MNLNGLCFSEPLGFLKYINEYYLFYSITIIAFASVFTLLWILSKYTYFEKNKIQRGKLPTFPYGNFGEVIKGENSLHAFLWRNYNRFKRKNCKFGGLYLFVKPGILVIDPVISTKVNNNNKSFTNIFPHNSKLNEKDVGDILKPKLLSNFVDKYNYCVKGSLPEKLIANDVSSALKDSILESACLIFGFKSIEIIEEVNDLLKGRYNTSLRYYLSLCIPLLRKNNKRLDNDLNELLLEIMEDRKKNELEEDDLMQTFINLYNDLSFSLEETTSEVFDLFADTLTFSYSTICMCLYELAANKDIQAETIGEIRRFNKKHRKVSYENLEELVFLEAVITETFRKHPPVATIISVSNNKNNTDFGNNEEKNKLLIFQSVLGLHRDPEYYIKPEAFDPDRFTEKGCLVKDSFIPFGVGTRSHICMQLTSLQVKIALFTIFSSLEVKLNEGADVLKYDSRFMHLCPCDLKLSFTRISGNL